MSRLTIREKHERVGFNHRHCPRIELHTSCPEGYIQWHAWAERMMKTHKQKRCPECGFWSIWVLEEEKAVPSK